jgi:glycosyltransferase involved in cell wall biosynthesis
LTTFHGTYNFRTPPKRAYNAVMTKGDRVIAISEFIARHILANYTLDTDRLRVVPRGVDLGQFDPGAVSRDRIVALATKWRLPDGVPVVMLPGRLTRWKGQAVLIEALARLRGQEFCCVLVGSDQGRTGYRRELEKLIVERKLADRVFISDDCRDMPAAYMLADVVVSASTDPEAFGRIASEAQAMGRPLVASAHGGVPEQVLEGTTTALVRPGDADDLARGLDWALSLDHAARAEVFAAGQAQARHFSKELMCRRTLAVYDELLDRDA